MTLKQLWEMQQLLDHLKNSSIKASNLLKQIEILCEETDKDVKDVKSANKRKGSQDMPTPVEA